MVAQTGVIQNNRYLLLLLVLLPLLHGCAQTSSINQQEVMEKAGPIFGQDFLMFYVPSSGTVEDQSFISLSALTNTSATARQLYSQIAHADTTEIRIAVGGPNSAKTAIVIINALTMSQTKLSQLHLVFVGEEKDTAKVKEAVASAGATYKGV